MPRATIVKHLWWVLLAAALPLILISSGCGGNASKNDYFGHYHSPDWLTTHPDSGIASIKDCKICHETTVLKQGGPAPSCMTTECHHVSIPSWKDGAVHGARAKSALGATGGSLVSCQVCHGADFKGAGTGVSCASCHLVDAPHPPKPWHDLTGFTHTTTDPSNAAICAGCHYPGSPNNPANHPATSAPAGTAPGCFNNTMCHGQGGSAPHALGSVWLTPGASFHGLEAKKNLAYCQTCHGTPGTPNFDGGLASTKCSTCHTDAKAHAVPWSAAPVTSFPSYTPSHRNALNMSTACSICHDFTKGRTAPVPTSPSCYSATFNGVACHVNGPALPNHTVPFLAVGHTGVIQATFTANCGNCHAVTGSSPVSAAPLCTVCHQAGTPLTLLNCTSCHSKPPVGGSFPDIAGTHTVHNALTGVAGVCSSCHSGFDSGSQNHYDHANGRPGSDALRVPPGATVLLATYNAKAAPAAFSTTLLTCSNVSCHGGITTPNWRTGAFDATSNAGCLQCHALGSAQGTPENNSPYSGAHVRHMTTVGALCTDCHSMTNGTTGAGNHFTSLGTAAMEGPAGDTVQYLGSRNVYDPVNKTCTLTCHNVAHAAFSWFGTGLANHSVPFQSATHTAATAGSFASDCANCHAVTGSSPMSTAPLCTVCHAAGSPLTLTNCTSCHARPPTGTVFPAVAGAHSPHNALTGVVGACATCHAGSDTGSATHYNHANARPGLNTLRVPPGETGFATTYQAKAGAISFSTSALTCSNISCHGAITTPNWQTGSIDPTVHAGCVQCHTVGNAQGSPESNSPFSGAHTLHMGSLVSAQCTDCHSMTNGTAGASAHFTSLETPAMEGPASDTVQPGGSRSNYNSTNQTCTLTCHSHVHSATPWTGSASHSVPFLSPTHTTVTSGGFTSSCATCHAVTGSSPNASAPLCTVCHTAASPLTVTNCASCHSKPPVGSAFPDVAGKHSKHNAFTGLIGNCAVCHLNQDTGTQLHYDHANARPNSNTLRVPPGQTAFTATFNAKGAAGANFDSVSATCSNVSCHGGITTPSWPTGTIDTLTQCTQCHTRGTSAGNPQNNSPYSGHHGSPHSGFACTECHTMTSGSNTGATNHFTNLSTPAMEGPASTTVTFTSGTATGARTYSAGRCNLSCHGETHSNYQW